MLVLFVAGAGYALFLLTWGLNYQRLSFARSAGLQVRLSDRAELASLSASLIEAANALREGLPEDEHGAMRLADGARGALTRTAPGVAALMKRYPWLPGSDIRPKAPWTSPLLAHLGIGGFYSPLVAEPHVNTEMSPSEVPFSAAHEVAHQLGFAREDEANYLGYLVCRLHPDADFRYSGVFVASRHVQRALGLVDRAEARTLDARRSPAVKRDIAALAAWVARYRGPAMTAFNRVNDTHLRIQGQRDGARSYGRMVDLLLAERRSHIEVTVGRVASVSKNNPRPVRGPGKGLNHTAARHRAEKIRQILVRRIIGNANIAHYLIRLETGGHDNGFPARMRVESK